MRFGTLFFKLMLICSLIMLLTVTPVNSLESNSETGSNLNISSEAPVLSVAPLNPAFVQYMQEQQENENTTSQESGMITSSDFSGDISVHSLSNDTEKSLSSSEDLFDKQLHSTGLMPSPIDFSYLSPVSMEDLLGDDYYSIQLSSIETTDSESYLSSRYDLREQNGVTGVRDQGNGGSCWAHSATASLESVLLFNSSEVWDFSENNIKNTLVSSNPSGFTRTYNDLGMDLFSAAYFTRWSGPVMESDDPYNDLSGASPDNLPVVKHVQNIFILPGFEGNDPLYKWMLTHYGAISVTTYHDNAYFDSDNNSYYYNGPIVLSNHVVTLVGWDDNYSASNFTPRAPGDGAFIIKNSWSDNWGDNGYYYVSYYDSVMGNNQGASGIGTLPYVGNFLFTAENVSNYDRIYQYDELGWSTCVGYNNNTALGANIFTAISNETLEAVSFYSVDSNSFYNISIYLDPQSGPVNSSGPVSVQNGTIAIAGYHTIDLDTNVSLNAGQNFSVVVQFTTPNYRYPIAIETVVPGYTENAYAQAGQSYMSFNGNEWADLSASYMNICIKAFTTEEKEPQTAFVAGTKYVHVGEEVDFHDVSLFSPDTWQWDFGDSSTSSSQNPLHSYSDTGIYTVSLNASNSYGNNISTRESFIHVLNSTIVVNSSGSADFTTIREAVDAASDGDTIVIEPGTYNENPFLKADHISLVSSTGNPDDVRIVSEDSDDDVIYIRADNITISGVTTIGGHIGLLVGYSSGCNISNCYASGNRYGVYLSSSDANTIQSCNMTENRYGAYLFSSNDNTISSCNISDTIFYGLVLTGSSSNLICNNYFNNTYNGHFSGSSPNYWNSTMAAGSNIINGSYLGGNYWAKPDGTGWSQTESSVGNGFCAAYEITAGGNNTDYLPLTKNAVQPDSGDSSSGNDNGGVRVKMPAVTSSPSNIAATDSSVRFVGKDAEVEYVFTGDKTPVTRISFESKRNEGYVMATVTLLNELPESSPASSSVTVYQGMEIVLGDEAFSSGIGNAGISFSVSKQWLEANGFDETDIHMEHFSDGIWNRLSTTITGEDDEYSYFEATTDGFSPFIICVDNDNKVVDSESMSENVPAESDDSSDYIDSDSQATDSNNGKTVVFALLFIVLAGIIGVVYWMRVSGKNR